MITGWEPLKPHRLQSEAWFTKKKFVVLACGRGSGKTMLARRRVVRNLANSHDLPMAYHAFCMPTFAQARRVAWEAIKLMVPKSWILGEPSETEMSITTIFRSKLFIAGLDKPARIEGTQWSTMIVDESCDVKPGVFNKSIMPALLHHCTDCWRIGVPKRQGPGAAEFREAFDEAAQRNDTFAATWPSSDVVDEAKIEEAKARLDKFDFDEQYGANWQTLGGGIFHSYDDVANVSESAVYRRGTPVVVMSDFNVDPMSWCLGQYVDDVLYVFDEISLRNTNTRATLDVLHSKGLTPPWLFTGDAAAKARKSSADSTDYIQIFNDPRFENRRVVYPSHNPAISTRFATTNAALCNAAGKRRVLIHPKCKVLRRDLLQRAYKTGSLVPNDTQFIGHMSDALGYGIMLLMPMALEHSESPRIYSC